MTTNAKEKLVIYALTLIFFVVGVVAIFRWSGGQREVGLVVSFAGLGALAVIQTVKLLRKNKKNR